MKELLIGYLIGLVVGGVAIWLGNYFGLSRAINKSQTYALKRVRKVIDQELERRGVTHD